MTAPSTDENRAVCRRSPVLTSRAMKRVVGLFRVGRPQLVALLVSLICVAAGDAPATASASVHRTVVAPQNALSKMGVASAFYLNNNPQQLSRLDASWVYDWLPQEPSNDAGMQWVPMVPNAASVTPGIISSLTGMQSTGAVQYLLGFNEPDMRAQSDMTPEQAADLWPELESTGLQLGSPAPARPDDGWLQSFMALAHQRHLRVNFIALHFYQDFTNPDAVTSLRRELIQIHNTYKKPIWITEIGAVNIQAAGRAMARTPTSVGAANYLRNLFVMLNALPFVQRYAWFTDNASNPNWEVGALFNPVGELTPAGFAYQQIAGGLERAVRKARKEHH